MWGHASEGAVVTGNDESRNTSASHDVAVVQEFLIGALRALATTDHGDADGREPLAVLTVRVAMSRSA